MSRRPSSGGWRSGATRPPRSRVRCRPSRRTASRSRRRPSCGPGQLDQQSLPPYELLDEILDRYVEQDRSSAEIVAAGFEQPLVEKVLRMVDAAEYKRRQYPPGPKISVRNFGRDRRLPITNRWRETPFPT
jgi:NAD+ synthase (glutamine-hydrolysing)